ARELLTVTPFIKLPPIPEPGVVFGSSTTPISTTDLVKQLQSAGQLATPSGPTFMYLNFSGWTNCPYNNAHNITPFQGTFADQVDILYRTAEIFAPFNVEVLPLYGDGRYSTTSGATTVFVGGNGQGNFTPGPFCDYASTSNTNGGTSHLFNTDPYDVALV